MSENDIQSLRIKIIKGISSSSNQMVHQKIKDHSSIAVMQNDSIKVLSHRSLANTIKRTSN